MKFGNLLRGMMVNTKFLVLEELVNGLDFIESFTLYGRKSLKYHIKRLQEENQQLKEKYNKALELLVSYKLPCDIDNFNTIEDNIEYCIKNCSVDEEIFIKCWDRFITQKIEKSDK